MPTVVQDKAPVQRARPTGLQEVLTLRLGTEDYAINILHVQELRSFEAPTRIAGAPDHMLGVLKLRGEIVPTVDLRVLMGVDASFDTETVTMVLNIGGHTVGAVVDSVSDVVQVTAADLKPMPEFGSRAAVRHIAGIATLGQGACKRMLIVIEIDAQLSDEFSAVQTVLQ